MSNWPGSKSFNAVEYWLWQHVGEESIDWWEERFVVDTIEGRKVKRNFYFKRAEDETLFKLKWANNF